MQSCFYHGINWLFEAVGLCYKKLDPHTMYMSNLYWYEPYTASQSIQFESSLLDPVSKATGSVLNLYHIQY